MACEPDFSFCDDREDLKDVLDELEVALECVNERMCEEEPMAKRPRFAHVSCDEVLKTIEDRVPGNTKKATAKWLRVFDKYAKEKGIVCDLRTISAENLGSILEVMYLELRQRNSQGEPSWLPCCSPAPSSRDQERHQHFQRSRLPERKQRP